MRKLAAAMLLLVALTACSSNVSAPTGVKVGKPYNIAGKTYYPQYDPHYDRTGVASWYGPGFHGGSTANGERFNENELTAAHPTLPMPSLVRVTNLENGKSQIIRINDRGPFKDDRLIDLSKGSAKALGVTGLARVRVQYLPQETETYWAQNRLKTGDIEFAKNDPFKPTPAEIAQAEQEEEDSLSRMDGAQLAQDGSGSPQVKDSAPILSVASNELRAEDLKVRPIEPRFRVINEAEAKEKSPWELAADENRDQKRSQNDPPTKPSPGNHSYGQEVTLTSSNSRNDSESSTQKRIDLVPSGSRPGDGGKAKIIHVQKVAQEKEIPVSEDDRNDEPVAAAPPPAKERADMAPSSGGTGSWFVQAGSFATEANAAAIAKKLSSIAKVQTAKVDANGKTWHRVRLGPFVDRNSAEAVLAKAENLGASGARVVKQ